MGRPNDEKSEKVGTVVYRYSSPWIYSLESEDHWRLYWQQQKLMKGEVKSGQHVLEIGFGSGFTANYLRSKGVRVTTLDIDAEKHPDIVANIVTFDWKDLEYDHILAFEVFEHIPFVEFSKLMHKIPSVNRGHLFMSVPKSARVWLHLELRIPKIVNRTLTLATDRKKITEDHHFWEVGVGPTTYDALKRVFDSSGFRICEEEIKFSRLFFKLKSPKADRSN
jgi:cyclopropane fatty-acyl-phospholipid synthase-like methyltransferase